MPECLVRIGLFNFAQAKRLALEVSSLSPYGARWFWRYQWSMQDDTHGLGVAAGEIFAKA
jgi:hypothetical protein